MLINLKTYEARDKGMVYISDIGNINNIHKTNNLSLAGKAKKLAIQNKFFFSKLFKSLLPYLELALIVALAKFPAKFIANQLHCP